MNLSLAVSKKINTNFPATFLPITAGTLCLLTAGPCSAHGVNASLPLPSFHTAASHSLTLPSQSASIHSQSHVNWTQANFASLTPSAAHLPISTALSALSLQASNADYNLDLSSSNANIVLGRSAFGTTGSVTIQEGGASHSFKPGQTVTAAEFVAIQEVLGHNTQTITLDARGTASGGSFSLNQIATGKVDELVIPTNVTAVDNVSVSKSISFAGDLFNYGSLDAVATNAGAHSGTISALDIVNEAGASISAINKNQVDLTLSSANNLTNLGSISSTGALSLAVGSGNLQNSGSLTSTHSNINISSAAGTYLNIGATGGKFSATSGDINLRDASYNGASNININGGDYYSKNLNIYAGSGAINGAVGDVSGKLNTSGDAAHFSASTDTLTLGSNCLKGDPTFVNTTGSIVINGAVLAGEGIAIFAAGNITAVGDAYISTANAVGLSNPPSTQVTIVAGAVVTSSFSSTTATLPGSGIVSGTASVNFAAQGLGGNIDFSKSTHQGPIIDTHSTLSGAGFEQADGGVVSLAAVSTSATNGRILFPSKVTSIDTSSVYGVSGVVQIIAGNAAGKSTAPSISVNNILTTHDSQQGSQVGSNIVIRSAAPVASDNALFVFNSSGGKTSSNSIIAGTSAAGYIQLTGTLMATGETVAIITSTGVTAAGVGQVGTGLIVADTVNITTGSLGVGTKTVSLLTNASNLNLSSGSSVYVNNLGSVNLASGTAGNGGTFQLVTTPDVSGNGTITLTNTANIAASTGQLANIVLNSNETLNLGTGGIVYAGSGVPMLVATTITLSDGIKGGGNGSIGAIAASIYTQATNISVNTTGNGFIISQGAINVLASSAGNGQIFNVETLPTNDNNNASITLSGKIQAATGRISQIGLFSSEGLNVPGTGVLQKVAGLTANTIVFDDQLGVGGALGSGNASFGSVKAPIAVSGGVIFANTTGALVNIKNSGTGSTYISGTANGNFTFVSAGAMNVGQITLGSGLLTLTAGGNILDTGNVAAPNITLTAGGKGSIQGEGGTFSATNTLILNGATATVGTSFNPLQIMATTLQSNVTGATYIFNAIANNTDLLTLTSTTAKSQFSLISDGPILVNLTASKTTLTNATGIELTTASFGGGNADITYDNPLGGSKTQNLQIIADGTGNIMTSSVANILTATGLVEVTSNGGNIGGVIPITITAPNLALNTNLQGNGQVMANIIGKTNTNLLNSQGGSSFTLTSNAPLTLNNIFVGGTQAVGIDVVTSGTLLQTAAGASLAVGNSTTKATHGSIILQNSNTAKGSIFFGANTQVSTLVSTPGTGFDGSITVYIGSNVTDTGTVAPANVFINTGSGGQAFFGANGITANGALNIVNLQGANVAFDTNGQPATRITLGGGTVFTADPPVLANIPVSATSLQNAAAAVDPTALMVTSPLSMTNPSTAASTTSSNIFAVAAPALVTANASATALTALPVQSNLATASLQGLTAARYASQDLNDKETANPVWLSQTELSNGEIPAAVVSDIDLGIAASHSFVIDMKTEAATTSALQSGSGSPAVTKPIGKAISLNKGTIVVAPVVDTVVNTKFGTIKLSAKSLALIIAFDQGVSVYNLDDSRSNSVQIAVGEKTMTLTPGQHLTLSSSGVNSFGEINPAKLIWHRNMHSVDVNNFGSDLKLFTSEFSVQHAIFAVQPLKQMVNSNDSNAKKVANRLLKTMSIMSQLKGNGAAYKPIVASEKLAWAN